MSGKRNPFATIFGQKPSSYISRSVDTDKILNDFRTSGHSEICIITNVRGSGKTVINNDSRDIERR